jgi:hypothetical protein
MIMPRFSADVSLYKTSGHYRIAGAHGAVTIAKGVLPFAGIGACMAGCASDDYSCLFDCLGGEGGLDDSDSGDRRVIERSRCVRDMTSSTGWRLLECTTVPGVSGQATRCIPSDECPAPGCGQCTCVGHTCTRQCLRYSPLSGRALTYTVSCLPPPPPWTWVTPRPVSV